MIIDLSSADAAEAAFYHAFENGDMAAMQALWDDADDVLCVHPMGAPLVGLQAVLESWRALMASGERLRFTPRVVSRQLSGDLAVHHVHEHIAHGAELREQAVVFATNVYRRGPQGWRMIMHHGSPGRGVQPIAPPAAPAAVH